MSLNLTACTIRETSFSSLGTRRTFMYYFSVGHQKYCVWFGICWLDPGFCVRYHSEPHLDFHWDWIWPNKASQFHTYISTDKHHSVEWIHFLFAKQCFDSVDCITGVIIGGCPSLRFSVIIDPFESNNLPRNICWRCSCQNIWYFVAWKHSGPTSSGTIKLKWKSKAWHQTYVFPNITNLGLL